MDVMSKTYIINRKKLIIAVITAILLCLAVLLITGINAYMTDMENEANIFTIGEIMIDTLEPNYPGNGTDATEDLIPLQEVRKDPCLKNTGKNRAIAFQQIDIPMADVITADDDGTRFPQANVEVFGFRTMDGDYNSHHSKWVEISETYLNDENEEVTAEIADKVRRIYGYNTVIEEDEITDPVFDVVMMSNIVEGYVDNSVSGILVTTYAIQADNITDITNENWNEVMDADTLSEIFNVYMAQSAGISPSNVDNGNTQTLKETTLNVSMTVQNRHLKLNSGDEADAMTTILYNVAYTGPNTKPEPEFTSSDTDVVTVDSNGNIRAVGVGKSTITISAVNPDTGKKATASVIVSVRDMNAGE